jgi:dGTP triphosphohydrolase
MKYQRLSKEQFEILVEEFSKFLAVHGIDKPEWERLQTSAVQRVDDLLDEFSDLIWKGVLSKVKYLENLSEHFIYLFSREDNGLELIAVEAQIAGLDLRTSEGFKWLKQNYLDERVIYRRATKAYSEDPFKDIFELIQKGAVITKGDLYIWFKDWLDNN